MTRRIGMVATAVIAAAGLSACTVPRGDAATRPAGTPTGSVVAIPGLGTVSLPRGFHVLGTWRLPPARVNLLTRLNGDLYWLTDGRHSPPQATADLHRVERLDLATGRITTVADSGASIFGGIAAGTDGLVVAVETPAPSSQCGTGVTPGNGCVRPVLESLAPDGTMRPLAASDPQPVTTYDPVSYSIDQVATGVLLETLHDGRRSVASWHSLADPPTLIHPDPPPTSGFTTVGAALVGQLAGSRGAVTVGGPALPPELASHGLDPTGSATHLAWFVQSPGHDKTVFVSTQRDSSYTTPVPVLTGDIEVLEWAGDCLLYIREFTGLFVAHVCTPGTPVERVLSEEQGDAIDNFARFAASPGRFAFVAKTPNAEFLVLLRTPVS